MLKHINFDQTLTYMQLDSYFLFEQNVEKKTVLMQDLNSCKLICDLGAISLLI